MNFISPDIESLDTIIIELEMSQMELKVIHLISKTSILMS